ncbi:hypothetical protein J7L02_02540, partial [Candidatus Woesearchaeota archaeon]|nr:hypothetical protein [Candidatus Woesearchaeota archaeon]
IDFLLGKQGLADEELYHVVKDFFKQYLHLDYEFTFEELIEEFDKVYLDPDVKQELIQFISDIGLIEFSENAYNEREVKEFLKSFAWLIDRLIPLKVKENFFDPELKKIVEEKPSEVVKEEEFLKQETPQAFKYLVREASKELSNNNVEKAKALYLKALQIYNKMSDKDKAENYKLLRALYNMLR